MNTKLLRNYLLQKEVLDLDEVKQTVFEELTQINPTLDQKELDRQSYALLLRIKRDLEQEYEGGQDLFITTLYFSLRTLMLEGLLSKEDSLESGGVLFYLALTADMMLTKELLEEEVDYDSP